MDLDQLQAKAKKYSLWIKVGMVAVVGLIVAPVIYMSIQGLIGLAIAGVVGMAMVSFAPAVGEWFGNKKLAALKAVVAMNPVETLQRVFIDKQNALHEFKNKLEILSGKVRTFRSQLKTFEQRFPNKTEIFAQQLTTMEKIEQRHKDLYVRAQDQLRRFEGVIEEAQAMWEMSQAARAMNAAADFDVGDEFAKIKSKTALSAIEESMNLAFAQLDVALLENKTEHLNLIEGEVIPMALPTAKTKVLVEK